MKTIWQLFGGVWFQWLAEGLTTQWQFAHNDQHLDTLRVTLGSLKGSDKPPAEREQMFLSGGTTEGQCTIPPTGPGLVCSLCAVQGHVEHLPGVGLCTREDST